MSRSWRRRLAVGWLAVLVSAFLLYLASFRLDVLAQTLIAVTVITILCGVTIWSAAELTRG